MKKHLTLFLLILSICSCATYNQNRLHYSKIQIKDTEKVNVVEIESPAIGNNQLLTRIDSQNNTDYALISNDVFVEIINPENISSEIDCDALLLRSGEEILVKVIEIGTQVIKYKKCDNLEGPTISVLKNDVFMITYSNGTKDVFIAETKNNDNNQNQGTNQNNSIDTVAKTNGFAIASLIFGIMGIIPILGIVFGAIAKHQIRNNPRMYAGEGMATAGIILSIIWLVLLIIILLLFSL